MLLGVIGDDFTGSSDIANNLKKAGMSVGMYSGVPDNKMKLNKYNAVVIALKTRTIPIKKAISESVKALEWLKSKKCKKIIFKYCSTFDSTKKGNIGPVIDAIMKNLNVDFTIACPSFPDAGRTLYQGHMFVNGVPLNESGMENHPLTPMTDHNLVRWLNYQTKGKVDLINSVTIKEGAKSIKKRITELKKSNVKYAITDTLDNQDFDLICSGTDNLKFLTGGSGIALGLPKVFKKKGMLKKSNSKLPNVKGNTIILSGSCSLVTNEQVELYKKSNPSLFISPEELIKNENYHNEIIEWILRHSKKRPLIYSTALPKKVSLYQKKFGSKISSKIETLFQKIIKNIYKYNFNKIVCAGGETSGAIVKALMIKELQIGEEISAGVPVMWEPEKNIKITLKSGNFGQKDFFSRALKKL